MPSRDPRAVRLAGVVLFLLALSFVAPAVGSFGPLAHATAGPAAPAVRPSLAGDANASGPAGAGGTGSLPVLYEPDSIVYDPANGDIYVVDGGSDYVTVFDGANNVDVATVPVGIYPSNIVVDPVNGDLYVSNQFSSNVSVIDGATNRVVAAVTVSPEPAGLAVDDATGDVYVASEGGGLTVISGANNTAFATFQVGIGFSIEHIAAPAPAFDPVNAEVYALGFSGYDSSCGCAAGEVVALNGSGPGVLSTVPVGLDPTNLAIAGVNGEVYVANGFSGNLSVLSPVTDRVIDSIPGFFSPTWLTYAPSNGDLYVGDLATDLKVISTATHAVVDTLVIQDGPGPMSVDPALNVIDMDSGGTNVTPSLVHVISLTTDRVVSEVYAGPITSPLPLGLTFDPATGNLYVLNSWSSNVSVIGPYPVTFTPVGLPHGVTSAVTLVAASGINQTLRTHGRSVTFYVANGSYSFSASIPSWYASSSASGTIQIGGQAVFRTVMYAWSDRYWTWLIGGSGLVIFGGFLALRWRGKGKSALRREYEAIFRNDLGRGPKE
ncbi:MAG: YncE family protein [Thermoplasmata archaeon]